MEVDEIVVGGKEKGGRGRQHKKKLLLVVGIEKKGRGVGRMYAKRLRNGGSKELRPFFSQYVMPSSTIRTDKWRGYVSKIISWLVSRAFRLSRK